MAGLREGIGAATALARTVFTLERPDRLVRASLAMAPWAGSVAGLVAAAAGRYPDRVAIHDDDGALDFRTLWSNTQAVGGGLVGRGVDSTSTVGLLARNHRGFVEAVGAVAATGADLVLLNTGFAGPQLRDVVRSEGIDVVIHDDEFAQVVDGCGASVVLDESAMRSLRRSGSTVAPRLGPNRIVILTSGTTGRPKGAARTSDVSGIVAVAGMLDRIPFRVGDVQVVPSPFFHAWGFGNLISGLARCATTVTSRTFDAAATVVAVRDHRARVVIVVPVMLGRLEVAAEELGIDGADLPDLEVIASSGSALPERVVVDALSRFGPVLYNLYGSTEVSVAAIATPDVLLTEPASAGRPVVGADVAIVNEAGERVPDGETGRIFVRSGGSFAGYTSGEDKERIGRLVSSGDVGFLRDGLLFVEGRDDDMIVSGGENVFPGEVEDAISRHPSVAEVAVVGVPDDEFGQVLSAHVVARSGADLSVDDVRGLVRERLARYKVPRHVTFVDELPRNETGKLLRSSLQP